MGNWSDLKASVAQVIKTNGKQQITGAALQNVLNNIISNLGENATFGGIATPDTNPGVPDGPVFYIASEYGTYSNFRGIKLNGEVAIFLNKNGNWVKYDTGISTIRNATDIAEKIISFSFNRINPDFLQLNKNVTDEGVIANFAGRMIYAINLNNNVTKVSTNAYKVFFYKDGIFQKSERGDNEPIQIIPGEADNIVLLMTDQRENTYYLYFNSDVAQYYNFGDTENFIDLSKKVKASEDEIGEIQNEVIRLNDEIDKVKTTDLISDIAQITQKGYIKINDGYYTGKVEAGNYANRSIVSVECSNGASINFTAKSDTNYPLYAIVDSENKVLVSENATETPQIKSFEINLLDYPTGTKLLYGTDFLSPDTNGYLYYNNKLLIEVEEIKKDVELHTQQIPDIQKKLDSVLYKIDITENSVIQLGRGYIKDVDGTIDVNSTLEGIGNAHNRRVLKIDVSNTQKIENLYVKSDANYFMYVLCDESGNILKEEKGTTAGDARYIDIDITQYSSAKWLLSGNDYNNPVYSGIIYYDTDLANDIIKLTEDVENLNEENDLAKYNLVTEYFQVRVNTKRPENNIATQNDYISENYGNDNCYFALPNNVKKDTKLIIVCHGGGQQIGTNDETTNEFISRCVIDTFRALGYATLATNGMPDAWAEEKGLADSSTPVGNWMALESIVKAYEYVMNKYSFLDSSGCYIWASSQGGMVAENAVELSNIPFKACCYEAPAISMRYVQLYLSYRAPWIQALYGFDSVETYDKNKCLGLDPFIRNMSEDIPVDGTTFAEIAITGGLDNLISKKYRKISPLLIQQGMIDGAVSPIITQAYIKAIQNAGNLAEFKGYDGIGHGVSSLTTKYSMQGLTPTPLYTTTGLLDAAKWFYRYGGYSIPQGSWGNKTE